MKRGRRAPLFFRVRFIPLPVPLLPAKVRVGLLPEAVPCSVEVQVRQDQLLLSASEGKGAPRPEPQTREKAVTGHLPPPFPVQFAIAAKVLF